MTISGNGLTKVILCLVFLAFIGGANANSIRGKVKLTGKNIKYAKVEDTIVYFEPDQKVQLQPSNKPHEIKMRRKAYHPRISAVTTGSEIEISNMDTILHNAFSPSKPNNFDMGLFGKNDGKTYQLVQPGVVRIFCNVHFRMVAYVLALDTPFYTKPNEEGLYVLDGLPEGGGRLVFWHERTKRVIKTVSVPAIDNVDTELNVSKRRVPEHKTKSGKSYKSNRKRMRKKRTYN